MTKRNANLDKQMTSAGPVTIRRIDGSEEVQQPHKVNDGGTRLVVPREVAARVWKRDGYQCRYCGVRGGKPELFRLDFKDPRTASRKVSVNDVVVACIPCTEKKGDRTWHPRVRSKYDGRKRQLPQAKR
jgi:hypothetical protein